MQYIKVINTQNLVTMNGDFDTRILVKRQYYHLICGSYFGLSKNITVDIRPILWFAMVLFISKLEEGENAGLAIAYVFTPAFMLVDFLYIIIHRVCRPWVFDIAITFCMCQVMFSAVANLFVAVGIENIRVHEIVLGAMVFAVVAKTVRVVHTAIAVAVSMFIAVLICVPEDMVTSAQILLTAITASMIHNIMFIPERIFEIIYYIGNFIVVCAVLLMCFYIIRGVMSELGNYINSLSGVVLTIILINSVILQRLK
jgi:hypothetical protein